MPFDWAQWDQFSLIIRRGLHADTAAAALSAGQVLDQFVESGVPRDPAERGKPDRTFDHNPPAILAPDPQMHPRLVHLLKCLPSPCVAPWLGITTFEHPHMIAQEQNGNKTDRQLPTADFRACLPRDIS
jgi:hypothetical protein